MDSKSRLTPEVATVKPQILLPALNALLNLLSAVLAVGGFLAIRRGQVQAHRRRMLAAAAASALFLASYLIKTMLYGTTPFGGSGLMRGVYLVLLFSHLSLAMVATPLVLITLGLGLRGRDAAHRRLARFTLPIWLYVSATGVLVYLMLRPYYGAGG